MGPGPLLREIEGEKGEHGDGRDGAGLGWGTGQQPASAKVGCSWPPSPEPPGWLKEMGQGWDGARSTAGFISAGLTPAVCLSISIPPFLLVQAPAV